MSVVKVDRVWVTRQMKFICRVALVRKALKVTVSAGGYERR